MKKDLHPQEVIKKKFSFTVECCVRGYHIFQSFWEAPFGSVLIAKFEDDQQSLINDKLAIALVNNDSVTVDNIPKFMSKLTHVFIKHGRRIKCEITGGKKYSRDLEQGGLEIPARLTISNTNKKMTDVRIEKLNPLVEDTEESTINRNSSRVLSILYITNFSETRKINSNAILFAYFFSSKFLEKQEVQTKLSALKIIFQRRCTLNN